MGFIFERGAGFLWIICGKVVEKIEVGVEKCADSVEKCGCFGKLLICVGVEFSVDFFEMRIGDVSVDLGGGYIGVT